MQGVPGFVPRVLRDAEVGLFRAEDRVFDAMLDGWKAQMLARGLTAQTLLGRQAQPRLQDLRRRGRALPRQPMLVVRARSSCRPAVHQPRHRCGGRRAGPGGCGIEVDEAVHSGVTWIRQRHVTAFLKDLAVAPSITHEKLDELPGADRTRNYVRGLLVEHDALPRRDELTVRYAQWATSALARVSGDDHRDVVRRFIRWHLQRRIQPLHTRPVIRQGYHDRLGTQRHEILGRL